MIVVNNYSNYNYSYIAIEFHTIKTPLKSSLQNNPENIGMKLQSLTGSNFSSNLGFINCFYTVIILYYTITVLHCIDYCI